MQPFRVFWNKLQNKFVTWPTGKSTSFSSKSYLTIFAQLCFQRWEAKILLNNCFVHYRASDPALVFIIPPYHAPHFSCLHYNITKCLVVNSGHKSDVKFSQLEGISRKISHLQRRNSVKISNSVRPEWPNKSPKHY